MTAAIKAVHTLNSGYNPSSSHKLPSRFWNNKNNQIQFLEWIGIKLNVFKLDDWYKVKQSDILLYGGRGLINKHSNSFSQTLMNLYPNHNWEPWKFVQSPRRYWKNKSNQKRYLEWAGKQLGIQDMDDWHKISFRQFEALGGAPLLKYYRGSLFECLQTHYPNHQWKGWLFPQSPKGYWNDISNVARCMSEIAEKLHIQTLEDWYRVSRKQMMDLGALGIINQYKSLANALTMVYPEHNWDRMKFSSKTKRSTQRSLKIVLQNLLPNHEVIEDYRHSKLVFPSTQREMEIDIFIPQLNLGFEYQGEHHFQEVQHFGPKTQYITRDKHKRTACEAQGVTLVEIPFWWDRKPESVRQSIIAVRPELESILNDTQ